MSRTRLCYVVASEMTVNAFLLDHIRAATKRFDVSVVANAASISTLGADVAFVSAPIERRIAPLADLAALFRLVGIFRRGRFDIVHSVTPKAGLLSALAGVLAGVPVRIHTFTGQVWAARSGLSRFLLRSLDRLTAALVTGVLADSASQREFLVKEGVVAAGKVSVLGKGSVNGVDAARFRPDPEARARLRAQANVPADAVVFLFVGRLVRDKGLIDLAHAFVGLEDGYLLLVGPDEGGLAAEIQVACGMAGDRLRVLGRTDHPQHFMAAADVFVLPSYREGFGSVVIEAAACGIPAIGTRIYGITDAIVENETGCLVPPRDPTALATAMRGLAADRDLRLRMGKAAREHALRDFNPGDLTQAQMAYYESLGSRNEAPRG